MAFSKLLGDGRNIAAAAAEEFRRTGTDRAWSSNSCRTGVEWSYRCYVCLNVPVRGPTRIVERRSDRQTGVPTKDTRELPSANNGVQPAALRVKNTLAGTEWHLPHSRDVDQVADVEVRVPIVVALTDGIDDKSAIACVISKRASFGLQAGSVVQRVGIRTVEIQGQ